MKNTDVSLKYRKQTCPLRQMLDERGHIIRCIFRVITLMQRRKYLSLCCFTESMVTVMPFNRTWTNYLASLVMKLDWKCVIHTGIHKHSTPVLCNLHYKRSQLLQIDFMKKLTIFQLLTQKRHLITSLRSMYNIRKYHLFVCFYLLLKTVCGGDKKF